MNEVAALEHLEWDSRFFGLRIARANVRLRDLKAVKETLAWCKAEKIDCLYYLADSEDAVALALVQGHDFKLVDVRNTLDRPVTPADVRPAKPGSAIVRPAGPADLKVLKAIAAASHGDTRFYSDAHFPRPLCDKLYETWIENSCQGYADAVLVAEANGHAAGYVSCHARANGEGQVGLIAVDAKEQGRGLGGALVEGALAWFASRGMKRCTVPTQGRNVRATRLYEKCGFRICSTELWFHRWFQHKKGPPG